MRHHVLIQDEAEPLLYRRILEADRPRLVPCPDGNLYRVATDPELHICQPGPDGVRLCDFDQPHDHGSDA